VPLLSARWSVGIVVLTLEEFHGSYAPSFYRDVQLFLTEKLPRNALPPDTPAVDCSTARNAVSPYPGGR